MRTEKQIEASRLNGAKSRGPTTEQGKRNSRRRSGRHSILLETTLLEEESLVGFNTFADAYFDAIQPRDPVERGLVECMIDARWRLNRVRSVAKTALDRDMALQDPKVGPAQVRANFALAGPTAHEKGCTPDLFLRYEGRYERAYYTALNRLTALRRGKSPFPVPTNRSFHPEPSVEIWDSPPELDSDLEPEPDQVAPAAELPVLPAAGDPTTEQMNVEVSAAHGPADPQTIADPSPGLDATVSVVRENCTILTFDPNNPLDPKDKPRDPPEGSQPFGLPSELRTEASIQTGSAERSWPSS